MGQRNTIADIKSHYVDLVRDAILGKKPETLGRPGLLFPDNGMRVVEVEVLELTLDDPNISKLLDQAQVESVQQLIEIGRARADLETTTQKERITQEKLTAQQNTKRKSLQLEQEFFQDQLEFELAKIDAQLKKLSEEAENVRAREALVDIQAQAVMVRNKAEAEQSHIFAIADQQLEIEKLAKVTDSAVARFNAAKDGLQECLVALHRDDLAAKLAEACTIERWLSGDSMTSAIGNLLSMFPSLAQFVERGAAVQKQVTVKRVTAE
jgi:major vault protein